jgi:hypothetical protein
VRAYFNLHKRRFSIVDLATGRVIDHQHNLTLRDCGFVVRQSGRRQVLRSGHKNVHAFILGELSDFIEPPAQAERVTYNPYKHERFVSCDNGLAVTGAVTAYLSVIAGHPTVYITGASYGSSLRVAAVR